MHTTPASSVFILILDNQKQNKVPLQIDHILSTTSPVVSFQHMYCVMSRSFVLRFCASNRLGEKHLAHGCPRLICKDP